MLVCAGFKVYYPDKTMTFVKALTKFVLKNLLTKHVILHLGNREQKSIRLQL